MDQYLQQPETIIPVLEKNSFQMEQAIIFLQYLKFSNNFNEDNEIKCLFPRANISSRPVLKPFGALTKQAVRNINNQVFEKRIL